MGIARIAWHDLEFHWICRDRNPSMNDRFGGCTLLYIQVKGSTT